MSTYDLPATAFLEVFGPSVVTLNLNFGCVPAEEFAVPTVSGENAVKFVEGVS